MAVDRLSVTVPSELGAALRKLAEARGETVSTLVTDAIAHQVRRAALELLLDDTDKKYGPVPDELIAKAEARMLEARAKRRRKPTRKAR
jgi:hypothetical protein